LAAAFFYRKKNPLLSLGIGWYFIGHLLESTIFPLQIAHEHRNYLPSIGLILALASLLTNKFKNSTMFTLALISTCLILATTTFIRSTQWENKLSQAYYEAAHHPESSYAQYHYSTTAFSKHKINDAFNAIEKAISLNTKETSYLINLQFYLSTLNKNIPEELQLKTISSLKENKITPTTALIIDGLSTCINKSACQGLLENYIEWLNVIIEKKPSESFYYLLKGKALVALGKERLAIIFLEEAHQLDIKHLQPLFEILDIHLKNNNPQKALKILIKLNYFNRLAPISREHEIELASIKVRNM